MINDYRLCCEFVLAIPGFKQSTCQFKESRFDRCGSLMRNHVLRVFIWIIGVSALIGNSMVVLWRYRQRKETSGNKTHSFLVLNLAISDLMMGIYMLIIAIADLQFGEKYFNGAERWRSGAVCKIAGMFSVISSQASVFFITIISIQCFLGIVFPYSPIKIRGKTSTVIVCIVWVAAACLSIVPNAISSGPYSKVYGLSDVCIGLPLITRPSTSVLVNYQIEAHDWSANLNLSIGEGSEPNWIYSIVLFLGVNMLCFMIVLCCYIAMFVSVKRDSARSVRVGDRRKREVQMAIKMALIVGTDFACWMPIIIMGILSQTGTVIFSADMYVWVAVFILPINSAFNPFLYTAYSILFGN